jgi:putative transposase
VTTTYLREQKLLVYPTKQYRKTTFSEHWMRKHPNSYEQLHLSRPEQAFVSDITYVESGEGVHYLSLVTDAYSRRIMGHALSRDMKTCHMVRALCMAIKRRQTRHALIHHSDRGLQYCSKEYQKVLRAHDIKPSMTDGYDCYQNALAERVNGILKEEFLVTTCNSFEELEKVVEQSIQLYNEYRPHLSLGMKTPEQVHNENAGYLRQPA